MEILNVEVTLIEDQLSLRDAELRFRLQKAVRDGYDGYHLISSLMENLISLKFEKETQFYFQKNVKDVRYYVAAQELDLV